MKKIKLSKIGTTAHSDCKNKDDAVEKTKNLLERMYDLLYLMFAHNRHSLLIILQGIDASGKDGTVRNIYSGANPQGMRVFSFKRPTEEEFKHDFLWRCHRHTPESGFAVIFNRSYYEDVTTARVHPEILKEQHIPDELIERGDLFDLRYESINSFEQHLVQKGTVIIKFLLHISKDEQKKRIEERLEDRSKNWKFSESDILEREFWDDYMKAFEKMVNKTSTKCAPWTVVPADDKWYRDYVVTKTIVERLEELKMNFPKVDRKKGKLKV